MKQPVMYFYYYCLYTERARAHIYKHSKCELLFTNFLLFSLRSHELINGAFVA